MRDIYKFIVFSCGISPEYFFGGMSMFEISAMYEAWYDKYKQDMEQYRQKLYYQAAPNMKSQVPIDKFMEFPWDDRAVARRKRERDGSNADFMKRIREKHGIVIDDKQENNG